MKTAGKEKYYSGQALAIVLIILLAGIIIALAIYSRTLRNKERIVQERNSEEASQYVDSVIDVVNTVKPEELVVKLQTECPDWGSLEGGETCCIKNETDDSGEYQDRIGEFLKVNLDDFNLSYAQNSEAELCFERMYEIDEPRLIKKDYTYTISFIIDDETCEYDLNFTANNGTDVGVIMHKLYGFRDADGDVTEFKSYNTNDIIGYKVKGGTTFNNWANLNSEGTITFPLSKSEKYSPVHLRLRAYGGDLSFTLKDATTNKTCKNVIEMRVVSTANNSGNEQSRYYYMPVEGSAPSLFDYVLFNGQGELNFTQ
jgi:hypothetical protein